MSINIRSAINIPSQASKLFVVREISQLKDFGVSDEEIKYLNNKRDEENNNKLITLNRLGEIIGVTIPNITKETYIIKEELRRHGAQFWKELKKEKNGQVAIMDLIDQPSLILPIAEGITLASYSFIKYKSKPSNSPQPEIIISSPQIKGCEIAALSRLCESVFLARDLVNEPVGYLTAEKLGEIILALAQKNGFKADIFNKKKIESLKMGGLLAVNKGSIDPPTFSVMEWKPENAINKKPVVLVGKGVMFDTGGVNLKTPPGSMDTMKCDMGGAASVVGAMSAISSNNLPVYVIGLVPATDNRLGGNTIVPGDILKMHNEKTVEVINTDAEGRLILADALSFSKKYSPELVIDLATLTGNAAIAIGIHGMVGMGTAPKKIQETLSNAGDDVCERIVWFPFWEDFDDSIKSDIADMKNLGEREGGAISAGKFLAEFIDTPWLHLDIAGPAFIPSDKDYQTSGGTGIGVRLLYSYLEKMVIDSK